MRSLIYLQVHRGHFIARHLGSGMTVRGDCAALAHPRTLMGDYHAIAAAFSAALKPLLPTVRLRRPKAMVHLLPVFEGGYTNVETRAFQEAAEAAGVGVACVSTLDRPHTDDEVRAALR